MKEKGVFAPLSSSLALSSTEGTLAADATMFRKVIGKLQYFSFTRPDFSFAVNKLSQFMHAPTVTHWKAVKKEF